MGGFVLKPEISIGDVLTTLSVIVSVIALIVAWSKDRLLKRREYADKIRRAAGMIIAKLERWRELSLSFFDEIQPIITDADVMLTEEQNLIATRDILWRNVIAARAAALRRILDEEIEVAYADLYGYDPKIQNLFVEAVNRLRLVDKEMYALLMMLTQKDVLGLESSRKPYYSAQLGNLLRETSGKLASEHRRLMDKIVMPFQEEMVKLIKATDNEIVSRQVQISAPDMIFPNVKTLWSDTEFIPQLIQSRERPFAYYYDVCARGMLERADE